MTCQARPLMRLATVLMASAVEATVVVTNMAPGIKSLPCGPRVAALCREAAQIDDKAERDAALTALFSRWLQSDDHSVRVEAFTYLRSIERFFDPRPLRSEIDRFDTLENGSDGAAFLARAEFSRSSREVRLAVYRQAIIDGVAPIGAGESVFRARAMIDASLEGLDQLRDLIAEYYRKLGNDELRNYPLDELMADLELRAGAADRDDAVVRATHRLAAMPSSELWTKCKASEGWRLAIATLAGKLADNAPESVEFKEVKTAISGLRTEFQISVEHRASAPGVRALGATSQLTERDKALGEWFSRLP